VTTAPLVFLDTETTGLSLDDDIWEFAGIRREADGSEVELHLFIEHSTHKCRQLPDSFLLDHQRRFPASDESRWHPKVTGRHRAAELIHGFTGIGRPHIVGAVPNFDTERLSLLLRSYGDVEPGWHYHLIDVENLAVGWIHGGINAAYDFDPPPLPWRSDDLSRAVGVEPPGEGERHTAMGDARWAMRLYDRIVGGA
jgi:hypothetical protein